MLDLLCYYEQKFLNLWNAYFLIVFFQRTKYIVQKNIEQITDERNEGKHLVMKNILWCYEKYFISIWYISIFILIISWIILSDGKCKWKWKIKSVWKWQTRAEYKIGLQALQIIYKKTDEWHLKWQRVTANDNKW